MCLSVVREKRTSIRKTSGDFAVILCEQGQRSGKIHIIFQEQLREGSPLSYHRSEQTAPLCHDRRSKLLLPLSLHLSFPYSLYRLTTWHQAAHSPSICSYSQAEGTLRDRWMDEGVGRKKKKTRRKSKQSGQQRTQLSIFYQL